MNAQEVITEALLDFVELANDRDLVQPAGRTYRAVAQTLDPVVIAEGGVELALLGMIIANVRVEAIAVITPQSVTIAWQTGLFKKRTESVHILRSTITSIAVNSAPSSMGRAKLLTIQHAGGTTTFALPVQSPAVELKVREVVTP